MKNTFVKRVLAVALAGALAVACFAGCGQKAPEAPQGESQQAEQQGEKKGTIMWVSNLQSGSQYEASKNFATAVAAAYGYDFKVVYGDSFNDPAGNLEAVKNGMTNDVVGIISSMDGGLANIMEEYPELYVAGYNSAHDAVFNLYHMFDGADSTNLVSNPHYLGTIVDGYADGADTGAQMFNYCMEKGYSKVATIIFPGYAYPNLPAADGTFRAMNEQAGSPLTIVGDAKLLEFQPLDPSWFMEEGNGDLDAIVAFCAGAMFVYPAMKDAIAQGTCAATTKLVTSGFEDSVLSDIGGEGVIDYITISPTENVAWSVAMVAKAVSGEMYSDWTGAGYINSAEYIIDSKEIADAVATSSILAAPYSADKAQITPEQVVACQTYAELCDLFHSEAILSSALLK